MYSILQRRVSYKNVIAYLSFMTSLFAFGCIFLGYLTLPFAAAFYAALLLFEKPEKRVLSYLIPTLIFLLNFIVRGFSIKGLLSLEGIAYAAIGLIIYFTYSRGRSKGEAVFFSVLLMLVMFCVSAVFLAFNTLSAFGSAAIEQFYSGIFTSFKSQFITAVTSLYTATEEGQIFFIVNRYEANEMFRQLVMLIIPIAIISAFVLTGIAFKAFAYAVRRYSDESSQIYNWSFKTSNFVAYFYIAVAILNVFISAESGLLAQAISIINSVFLIVFAYLGFNFVFTLLAIRRGPMLALLIIILAFMLFSSFAMQLLSFIGVYYNIAANKAPLQNNHKA